MITLASKRYTLLAYGTTLDSRYPLGGSGSAGDPDLTLLPVAVSSIGDWSAFPGSSWALNTAFVDTTGVDLRRITNATYPAANSGAGFVYATGGPRISRPHGVGSDQYWVLVNVGTTAYCGKYTLGAGIDSSSWFAIPAGGVNLEHCFSSKASDPHILYIANGTTIHRYDVNARAYAANAVFAGANASISSGGASAGWLQQNWDGSRMVWQTPVTNPTAIHHLAVDAGTLTSYTGAVVADVNEPRIFKGTANVVTLVTNSDDAAFWFVDTNVATAVQTSLRGGHSESGESTYYSIDPDTAAEPLAVQTPGTAPAGDDGAWNGSRADRAGAWVAGNYHPSMAWDQTGASTSEYYCIGAYSEVDATLGVFSVYSGAIYQSTVTPGIYGGSTRGVVGVITVESTAYTGELVLAASLEAMIAGTYFYTGTTLYVWMPDSSDPTGKVVATTSAKFGRSIGYIRRDGTDARKLCHTYRQEDETTYASLTFANWSPDGKIVAFNSNLGTNSGRFDVVVAEVPRS